MGMFSLKSTLSKWVALCICALFFLSLYMMGLLSSEDAEVEAYEKFLRDFELQRVKRESDKHWQSLGKKVEKPHQPVHHEKPLDWDVQFISGKDMVNVVEGEHRSIQLHRVTIHNLVDMDALVQCRDSFTKFSHIIPPNETYEFSVTDIFHKRHYWCTAHFGKLVYQFLAYGEGAPRDNNQIMLKKEGAFINQKDVTKQNLKPSA